MLDHENVTFYLHFDKKIDYSVIKSNGFLHRKRTHVLKTRYNISWGGFSMVNATIALLKAAIKKDGKGYFILLSGQDLPIKDPSYIYHFLESNYSKEYLDLTPLPYKGWAMNEGMDRINYYWFMDQLGHGESYRLYLLQKQSGVKRPYFEELQPYGGSQWWCLTYECVQYLLTYLHYNKIFQSYYETTFVPDESFFNTLIANSPFKYAIVPDNLRYIDWKAGPEYPKILRESDIPALAISPKLWARKFEIPESDLITHIKKFSALKV